MSEAPPPTRSAASSRGIPGRALACLLLALIPSAPAAAQCRAATAAELTSIGERSEPAPGIVVGRCANDAWCVAVGTSVCDTGSYADEVTASVRTVSDGRVLLLLRWQDDHGGNVFHAGRGLQVWTTSPAPTLALSVVEQWDEGEWDEGDDEPRSVCTVRRDVAVTDEGITLGRRTARGRCRETLALDRRRVGALAATAATYPWSALR